MLVIKIKNLRLKTIIGVLPFERKKKQEVVLNIKFEFDASKASKSDNIKDTIDYNALTEEISRGVVKSHFYLLEALVDFVLNIILKDKRIKKAKVEIDKPNALKKAESVSVKLKITN